MCIFSRPVISVNNTQIFARLTGRGTQFLAYQMHYESRDENAMILPFPVRAPVTESSMRFIDLEAYPELFRDLDRGFPFRLLASLGCGMILSAPKSARTLVVQEVGNYIASFIPTLADFDRLSEQFRLPAATWNRLPRYKDFGFAVFQLAAGNLKPHPMAFEFESASSSIFFPTLHIHDGAVHDAEEFDHVLYMQHAGLDSQVFGYRNSDVCDLATGLIRSENEAKHFCKLDHAKEMIDGELLVHRQFIRGRAPNQDTEFVVSGDPEKRSMNLRPVLTYAPWMLIPAAMGWFFWRRGRVQNRNGRPSIE
jgi:hypothetical protein